MSRIRYTIIAGKFGKGKVWWIICDLPNQSHSKLYLHIITFWLIYSFAKLFCQTLRKSKFAKRSHHHTFCYTVCQLDGKSTFGIQVGVFPPYIACAGKILPPAGQQAWQLSPSCHLCPQSYYTYFIPPLVSSTILGHNICLLSDPSCLFVMSNRMSIILTTVLNVTEILRNWVNKSLNTSGSTLTCIEGLHLTTLILFINFCAHSLVRSVCPPFAISKFDLLLL